MKDPYEILEVPAGASEEQIREQYHLLVHAWHPDKFRNPKQRARAEERMKEINTAYAALIGSTRSWKASNASPGESTQHAGSGAEAYTAKSVPDMDPQPSQTWEPFYTRSQTATAQWAQPSIYYRPTTWLWFVAAMLMTFMIPLAFSSSVQRWVSDLLIGAPGQPERSVGSVAVFQPDLTALHPRLASLNEAEAALKNEVPFIEDLTSDSRIAAPGEQVYQVRDLRKNEVLVGWKLCAQSQSIIDTYWPNLDYMLSLDRQTSGRDGLYMIDFDALVDTSTAGEQVARCRLLYTALMDWPIGNHEIVFEVRSRAPLDTGWETLPNGVFSKRVYKITVEHGLFRLPEQ